MKRREFLKLAGAASAARVARGATVKSGRGYAIVVDAHDPVANSLPVRWAAEQLREALAAKGKLCQVVDSTQRVPGVAFQVLVGGVASEWAKGFPHATAQLSSPESLRLTAGKLAGTPAILVSGSDQRGFVYALLELAERVRYGSDAAPALRLSKTPGGKSRQTKCAA